MVVQKIKTLIVGAHAAELKPFCDMAGKDAVLDGDVAYLCAGIGPVAASFGLTHFLEHYRPERILAVGTAGAVDPKALLPGAIVKARSVSFEGRQGSYIPAPMPKILDFDHDPKDHTLVHVFAPFEISSDPAWPERLGALGYDVENLEAYAYAFAARKFKIPIELTLGITNAIGPNAHKQWLEHEKDVMTRIANQLKIR